LLLVVVHRRDRGVSYTDTWPPRGQITVGGVPIGGGAPVVVQGTMTKTETANLQADDGPDPPRRRGRCRLVRVAVPRDDDIEA